MVFQPSSLHASEATLTGNEFAVWSDDDRMQQPDLGNAGGKLVDVAQVAAVALADLNISDRR